ncbi:hypothetical protein FRC11_010196, partial [Ceratobasidium sp. 423]
EDLRVAQEETLDMEDEDWSDSDVPTDNTPNVAQPLPQTTRVRFEPAPALAQEPVLIVLSSTNDENDTAAPPSTTPARKKAKTNVTEVKGTPVKRRKNAQAMIEKINTALDHTSKDNDAETAVVTRVEIFGRDCMIECLEKGVTAANERCHQLECKVDNVAMVVTMYGVSIPAEASDSTSGPALGLALAGFLRARIPVSVPHAAALATPPVTALVVALAVAPVVDPLGAAAATVRV